MRFHEVSEINKTYMIKPRLMNLSNVGNSYDNSNISVKINNKFFAEIFSSIKENLPQESIYSPLGASG